MNEREALERLGAIHAIAPDYYDIWGQRHAVSDASYVALLGALGVHARTSQEVQAAISAAELERLHGCPSAGDRGARAGWAVERAPESRRR